MVNDIFNIAKIYPDKSSGIVWTFDPSKPNTDTRFVGTANLTGDDTAGWMPPAGDTRYKILTPSGYDDNALPVDFSHATAASRGYFYAPTDWGDVEITCISKWNSSEPTMLQTIFCRGGSHQSTHWCPGFAYRVEINQSGSIRVGKEQFHGGGANVWRPAVPYFENGMVAESWFGLKFIVFNTDIGSGQQGVKLEVWIDRNNDNSWDRVIQEIDSGGWGSMDDCGTGVAADQIGTWKAPTVYLGFDNAGEFRIKQMSVREINPGGTTPPPPTGTRVSVSLRMHYRIGVSMIPSCESDIPQDPNPPPEPPPDPETQTTLVKKNAFWYDILQ